MKIARADERIAIAKAATPVAKSARQSELEETYFKLLIARRRLTEAEWKVVRGDNHALYASTSLELARGSDPELTSAAAEVKQLSASINRALGWPDDAELDPAMPEPLVENISFQEVAGKSAAANLEVVEAEQNLVKARAAHAISKLEYVPQLRRWEVSYSKTPSRRCPTPSATAASSLPTSSSISASASMPSRRLALKWAWPKWRCN